MGSVADRAGSLVSGYLQTLYPSAQQARPNSNHIAAARLLLERQATFLITTNFDECLEAAGLDDVVVAVDQPFEARPGSLLKLHGTVSRPDTLAATPDGLARRSNSRTWTESLLKAIGGRDIVFVGYGLRDWFDINPVLANARAAAHTRLFAAGSSMTLFDDGVALDGFVTDGGYRMLAELTADGSPPSAPGWGEQLESARNAISATAPAAAPASWAALQAIGSVLQRVEQGEPALHLFVQAAREPGAPPSDELIAGAMLRARRYRAAGRKLERALKTMPLYVLDRLRLESVAGHVAQAGGRPDAAAAHYAHAQRLSETCGIPIDSWPPAAADEFLRGIAEQRVHQALATWNRAVRNRLLDQAQTYYVGLADYDLKRGFVVARRLLVRLLAARIALARGDLNGARRSLEAMAPDTARWADPHLHAVHQRLLAAASPDRARAILRQVLRDSLRRRRWHEFAKTSFNLVGFHGYGRAAPAQVAARNLLVASYDWVKDASSLVYHRWAS